MKKIRNDKEISVLTTKPNQQEKELGTKIVFSIEQFLKELGDDFAFLNKNVPILIDNKTNYIDLVLFHRGIPCIVLVCVKIGKLNDGDIGDMNKYVSYYRKNKQYSYEKDAIGLILCKEFGHEEIRYSLGGLEEKIFVALYKIKLPSEDKIKRLMRKL